MCIINENGRLPGEKLKGSDKYAKLYHYTTFDTFVRIWLSKTLKFGVQQNLNDINEVLKTISTDFGEQCFTRYKIAKQILYSYKQISLTKDYDSYIKGSMSPLMWGHYGDKCDGICIELDYNKLHFDKGMLKAEIKYVKYLKDTFHLPPNMNTYSEIDGYILKHKKEIFFTKLNDWKGENEYRIISNKHDYLSIENAITAIYVANNNNSEMTENLVNNEVPVKLFEYQSSWSMGKKYPRVCNAKLLRNRLIEARNNPNNALNSYRDLQSEKMF